MSESHRQAVKIMVMRHAEKPSRTPPPYGVTVEGRREKESLSVRGWQRAGALAGLFAPADSSFQDPSLAEPQFLYASRPTRHHGSRRPVETLTPLAEKLALRINSHFPKSEAESMLEEVLQCPGVVLVCWQHDLIPQMARHLLGDDAPVPQDWPDDRFDVVWVFDYDPATARYSFKQVPQRLLMGDWVTPIR